VFASIKHSAAYIAFREWNKALRRRVKLPAWRGTEFQCPICGTGLRAFKPIWKSFGRAIEQYKPIHSPRDFETFNIDQFSCPKCDATDRERLTALYIERVFAGCGPGRRYKVIEFGPAHALRHTLERYPFVDYRSADLTRRDVMDSGVDLTDMRSYRTDNSVDVFFCSHMFEHVREDRKAMRELCRILRPDGFGIILVPLVHGVDETQEDPSVDTVEERWRLYFDGDHLRQYGKRDFLARLAEAGFQVEQLGIDFFGAEAFRRAGIAKDSILYVVRKPAPPH
jgi:SAM-dependent methyltransferase